VSLDVTAVDEPPAPVEADAIQRARAAREGDGGNQSGGSDEYGEVCSRAQSCDVNLPMLISIPVQSPSKAASPERARRSRLARASGSASSSRDQLEHHAPGPGVAAQGFNVARATRSSMTPPLRPL
jgi:hypothetical protein